jgi:ZIP family zinc transporter
VSAGQIAVPGAFADLTIFVGLPQVRGRAQTPRGKAFLNALAIGILIFLLWDVLTSAWEPAGTALGLQHYARAVADGSVLLACVGVGRIGLVTGFVTDAVACADGAWNPR